MQFRLITYNIHKGIGGVDRRYRPGRVIETLAHYRADIVLLQEVDEGVPRSRGHRQVDLLGDALDLQHRVFQPNVKLRQGRYGNAILSRFPLSQIRHLELTVPPKKRRRALAARCHLRTEHHTRTLLVYNFHLGLAGLERAVQMRRFLGDHVLTRTHHATAVIAAGDFNDAWGRVGRRQLQPAGFQPASGKIKTFPAIGPFRPLDRVYYRGVLKLNHCYCSRLAIARQASDHLPLIAGFEIE